MRETKQMKQLNSSRHSGDDSDSSSVATKSTTFTLKSQMSVDYSSVDGGIVGIEGGVIIGNKNMQAIIHTKENMEEEK